MNASHVTIRTQAAFGAVVERRGPIVQEAGGGLSNVTVAGV